MEEQMLKIAGGGGLVTILIFMIKFFFDYLKTNNAKTENSVQQMETKDELYELLRKEIALLRSEIEINRKKLIILEALAIKNGIDVYAEYEKHGLYNKKD